MSEQPSGLTGRLKVPQPLRQAVEAGVFGVCADGTYHPNDQELATIVRAQVDGLAALAIDIATYTRAVETSCHPRTGKFSYSRIRQAEHRRLARELCKEAQLRYWGHLHAYERAFGHDASVALHEFVLEVAASARGPQAAVIVQRDLF